MKFLFVITITLFYLNATAQSVPLNYNCDQSFKITNLENFCSDDVAEFTTIGATEDISAVTGCLSSFAPRGVWYNFTAITRYVRITVEGNGTNAQLTLAAPILGIFEGSCSVMTEIFCVADQTGSNINELVLDVTPGRNYFIFVGGVNNNTGTFRLCVNSFNVDPEPLQDCGQARILCDKSPIGVENISGFGLVQESLSLSTNPALDFAGCGVTEDASNWYKWTCDQAGTLEFTLTPLKQFDDLDFLVYEFPDGLDQCDSKVLLRNMISGENQGQAMSEWQVCVGPTGLIAADGDLGEACGCQAGDNNFASAINMEAGKSYGLLVMNFSQSGVGYNLDWSGTGTFQGPVPQFSIDPITGLRCDVDFVIEDRSQDAGNPLEYNWYFGEDATPSSSTDAGPFTVTYSSFGLKYIVLTVLDPINGCEVTEIFDVLAEPCCEDLEPIGANLGNITDPTCPTSQDGMFELTASGGSESGYTYSIDGSPFVNGASFGNLPDGTYSIDIIDSKGCEGTVDIELIDPDSIIVDAGLDSIVDLGVTIDLEGSIIEENGRNYDLEWTFNTESSTVSCSNCLDPTVLPGGETFFTLTAIDEFGCMFSDRVLISVDLNYPIYIPNTFSPNEDGFNDRFTAYGGIAIEDIQRLRIFDRWGNQVYDEFKFPHSEDFNHGWDGLYNGRPAEVGVYTYLFNVQFIDGLEPRKFSGSVTLLR